MLKYLMETAEATEEDLIRLQHLVRDRLSNRLGDKMTTLAERLQEKGRVEGRVEGMDEMAKTIARKLLTQKTVSVEGVAHMTNLPISVVTAIQKTIRGKH